MRPTPPAGASSATPPNQPPPERWLAPTRHRRPRPADPYARDLDVDPDSDGKPRS